MGWGHLKKEVKCFAGLTARNVSGEDRGSPKAFGCPGSGRGTAGARRRDIRTAATWTYKEFQRRPMIYDMVPRYTASSTHPEKANTENVETAGRGHCRDSPTLIPHWADRAR